ncbi:alpha-lytic protease prodomain-containing protein [Streptomyces sp. NPDC058955]|uniref:alpha-lytic protease prodomain-containing protein n=1 Tax=unclassified Streptomyces TaxID=2593676 RepID=UPI0036622107
MGSAALPASATEEPDPLVDPLRASALAKTLGDDRTGGVYYEDGRLVIAVTDQQTAWNVRKAGGTAKLVARSTAELEAVHERLDELGNIPNTAWGIDASTNQVSVEIFDGAPSDV